MSSLVHVRFDGVDGESTRKDHKGEIEITSWSWGVTNAKSGSSGSSASKAQPGDFVFTHQYDKASPVLAKRCASGTHIPTATLSQRRRGDKQKDFLIITLHDVLISSCNVSWTEDGDVVEQVSVTYGEIGISYSPQDDKGGLGAPVTFGWNIKTAKIT
jgi:type VI secretion system secreted protein Hcp